MANKQQHPLSSDSEYLDSFRDSDFSSERALINQYEDFIPKDDPFEPKTQEDIDKAVDNVLAKVIGERESQMVAEGAVPPPNRPAWLKQIMSTRTKFENWLIYFFFYLTALGIFFVWFSMTGTVFHWSSVYGSPDVLLWMTSIYSSPGFFIQLLQARLDFKYNQKYGKLAAFRFRGAILLTILIILTISFQFLPENLPLFLFMIFFLGTCSTTCYGTVFQLVALYPRQATSFLSLGYASPGVLLLFISRGIFGVPPTATAMDIHVFFTIVLGMAILAMVVLQLLLYLSKKRLSNTAITVTANNNVPEVKIKPNNFKILKIMWKSSVGIGILMISRLIVFTILLRVPSTAKTDEDHKAFTQTLVYINLSGDLIGRFLTVILPKLPVSIASLSLLIGILIHFLSVIVVLLYVYSGLLPINDTASQIFLGVFASCTGFFQTQSYIYAPNGVEDIFRTQVGALMNLSTQVGNFLGIVLSYLLRLI